jgi:hypothetical protein
VTKVNEFMPVKSLFYTAVSFCRFDAALPFRFCSTDFAVPILPFLFCSADFAATTLHLDFTIPLLVNDWNQVRLLSTYSITTPLSTAKNSKLPSLSCVYRSGTK